MMEKMLLYRYRSSLDAVVISNTRFNQDGLVNNSQAEVGYDILPPKWRELDIRTEDLRHLPFYRVYSPEEMDAMEERMEDSLESNYQNQGLA